MALNNNRRNNNGGGNTPLRQFGGLSYATVNPEFIGRPVEDIKESRKILQERSDTNRAGYMDLENTYGTLVDKVHESELPYLNQFKSDFDNTVADRIANDEFEYIGNDIARSSAKLASDKGMQVRFARKKAYEEAQDTIDKSDWSYAERVKAKAWQENQYKPVTTEEDVNMTYDDEVDYRSLPSQPEIAKELNTYFKNLTPDMIGSNNTWFVKAGADIGAGFDKSKLTRSYADSDKTGITYDVTGTHKYLTKDKIANYFKSLVDERVNPKIAEFYKTKYELANRTSEQTADEFYNSADAEGYDNFVTEAMNNLADGLTYDQNVTGATMKHFAGLMPKAQEANSKYKDAVSTYDYGEEVTTTAGSNIKEAIEIATTNKDNANRYISDQQVNLNVQPDDIKSYDTVNSELQSGKGLTTIIPSLSNQPVRLQQVAGTVQDQHINESIGKARFNSAFNYALNKANTDGTITDKQISAIKQQLSKSKGISKDVDDMYEDINGISGFKKFFNKLGTKVGIAISEGNTISDIRDGINEWYDDNSATEIDSQITTRFPAFEGEDKKIITKQITDVVKSTSFFDINKDVIRIQSGDYETTGDFVEGRLMGNVQSVDLLGYRPVPIDGQRHWKLHVIMKPEKAGTPAKEADILVPMNVLKTEATDMLMSLPQVKASDMLHQPMINGLNEWNPYPDTKIIYTRGIGTSLNINGTTYTDPDVMNNELAKRIEQDRQTIINGESKKKL